MRGAQVVRPIMEIVSTLIIKFMLGPQVGITLVPKTEWH